MTDNPNESIDTAILDALRRHGAMTSGQIREDIGVGVRIVWARLCALRTQGLVWHRKVARRRLYDLAPRANDVPSAS